MKLIRVLFTLQTLILTLSSYLEDKLSIELLGVDIFDVITAFKAHSFHHLMNRPLD